MVYRCSCCGRFIADIKRLNHMNLKGRDITIEKNSLKIVCKCKRENYINLERWQNENESNRK